MATNARRANSTVKKKLHSDTFQFDFHQAIELIQQMESNSTPLGEGVDPNKEALNIKTRVSLSPASSQIHSFTPPSRHEEKPTLWVNFLGIAGVQGPLPTPYTELLLDRNRQNDTAFHDFLDIFNHRLLSLWHRLKKKTFISYSQKDPRKTQIGQCLMSFSGLMNPYQRARLLVSDRTLLSYHDLLWRRPRSAYGLVKILQSHYKMPVKIHQFQGNWIIAEESDCTKIGKQYHSLGVETILGSKQWDQAAGIRIDMGPMTWQQLNNFLPTMIKDETGQILTGKDHKELKDLILFYVGLNQRIKLRFMVHSINVKPLRLNRKFALGENSWLTVGKKLQTPCSVDIIIAS